MPGEFEFLEWIRSQQQRSQSVPVPAGDDLAVMNWPAGDLLLVGVDQVLDGVHFRSEIHPPRQIGRKVMNRNLSDCAAMACLPAAAVATVALPRGAGVAYAQELYRGLRDAADPFDCPIIGGDTGSWEGKLALTVTILGRSAGVTPITRAGAKPGDCLYVSGPLGGSILGRHLLFAPRVALARQLATSNTISAMIDLSDGLSRDLQHLCRMSGVGAVVEAARIPIHDDARELSRQDHATPLTHALHDGEDHELLFTSPDAITLPGITRIGVITADPGVWLTESGWRKPLEAGSWEHSL